MRLLLIVSLVGFAGIAEGQKQLIVLKRENVLLRLYPGDEFIYRLKGGRGKRTSYVNNLFPGAVVTHRDTIPFNEIDRIYFNQHKFYNTVGSGLVIFGAGLFIIDQFNTVLVQKQSPSLDNNVSTLSLGSLAVGLPMAFFKKKSQKIRHPTRVMTVEPGSGFYRPDTREIIGGP